MNRFLLNVVVLSGMLVAQVYAANFITSLPAVITAPGVWQVQSALPAFMSGSTPASQVAITIAASNVILDLGNFAVAFGASSFPTTGILVKPGFSDITIQNGSLLNLKTLSSQANDFGIIIAGTSVADQDINRVIVRNIHTDGSFIGLDIENATNVSVRNSEFSDALVDVNQPSSPSYPSNPAGAYVSGSTNVLFDTDVFTNDGIGIFFNNVGVVTAGGANQDGKLTNCSLPNAIVQDALFNQISGLVIENSTFSNNGADNQTNLVQFGGLYRRTIRYSRKRFSLSNE